MPNQNRLAMPKFEFIPIKTVGLPFWLKLWVLLTESRRIRLLEDYIVRLPSGAKAMLPKGFESDGTSIPRCLRWLIGPFGLALIPGLFHDFEYRYKNLLNPDGSPMFKQEQSRWAADYRFRRLNNQINDMLILALLMYWCLRLVGMFAWNQHRKHDGTSRNDLDYYFYVEGVVNG